MKLAEAFGSPESRVFKLVLVVDLNNSTKMKEENSEAEWLTTYGWFFDEVSAIVEEFGGKLVKYLGDGLMAVFEEDNGADAINAGIRVQEAIADGTEQKRIKCTCSVAVSYGEMVEYETTPGTKDYIGQVVDRAFRLCGAANSKAVFVDAETVSAALMPKVSSRLGKAMSPKRKAQDYSGPEEYINLKGFATRVAYHEILWNSVRYAVSADFVTKQSADRVGVVGSHQGPAGAEGPRAQSQENPWVRGVVSWQEGRDFGFVRTDEEEFYVNSTYMLRDDCVAKDGDTVYFQPLASLAPGKNRRANHVIVLGQTLEGELGKVFAEKGFGFVVVKGHMEGSWVQLFVYLADSAETFAVGQRITFKLGENRQGPTGREPRTVVPGAA